MSAFCSPLLMQDNLDGTFTLHEPLIYVSDLLRRTITVPVGFRTDGASSPRGTWNVLPKIGGGYDAAAVVHDFNYQFNGMTRGQADAVLNEAMGVCGVSGWQRWAIYAGVRVGGWKRWNEYRAAEQARERA